MANQFKVSAHEASVQTLTIEPEDRYTAEQIVDLLNSGEARVSGDSVVIYAKAPAEGMWVLGRIVARQSSPSRTPWAIVTEPAVPASER